MPIVELDDGLKDVTVRNKMNRGHYMFAQVLDPYGEPVVLMRDITALGLRKIAKVCESEAARRDGKGKEVIPRG